MLRSLAFCAIVLVAVASARIPPSDRKFNSTSINALIANFTARMKVRCLAVFCSQR